MQLLIATHEIVATLTPLNGLFFHVGNLEEYAGKVTTAGKSLVTRAEGTGELQSYVLFYDNQPELFVSMVWTCPRYRGQGLAEALLQRLIRSTEKDIVLHVHQDNLATKLYAKLGFVDEGGTGATRTMRLRRRLAIMQPYVFPYIGYFHLAQASDLFVFYDDVQYTTRGWINRNRILLNGADHLFTVPVAGASQSRMICETMHACDDAWTDKFYRTLRHAYHKAPQFSRSMEPIMAAFSTPGGSIADLAIRSIEAVHDYLGLPFRHIRSSECAPHTRGLDRPDRLIEITRTLGYAAYVNAPGGTALYDRDYFAGRGVGLGFVESGEIIYRQYADDSFVPSLSIIDVMMFNDIPAARDLLRRYSVA